uniref:50S ribosomal protein L29 n=1 Tax=uncultured prokaryote TaxID=198431 RepID=H5SJY9_9ZZZZ|nr:50S ribosomal protein L29 [uncultured prokaryote]
MKPLKPDQLRRMTTQELEQELEKLRNELYRLRVQQAVRQIKDTAALRITRRNIARLQTILNEKRRQPEQR